MLEDLRFQQQAGEVGSGKEWGGRSLFLKQLQKYGNRLWQVREQKYITERETQKREEHKSGTSAGSLLIQKHLFW